MNRFTVKSVGAAAALSAVAIATVSSAPAANAAPAAADKAFVAANEQVNLAEITVGAIALQRSHSATVRSLATKTVSDHKAAMAKLKTLAASENITLPAAPNAAQQSQAATLKSVSASKFDLTYAQFQVAGHKISIAGTKTEISGGSDSSVVNYAKYYLPVAQMHLTMAQDAVSTLAGTPTSVPAGTGGFAATTSAGSERAAWLEGALGVLLVIGAALGLTRRRRTLARAGAR